MAVADPGPAPAAAQPAPDRAPESLAAESPQPLRGELEALLGPDRVLARAQRPRPLRLRRQPLPALPAGGGHGPRRRRRRRCARLRAPQRHPGHLPRRRAPASTGRRRATGSWSTSAATSAASRSRRTAPRCGSAREPCSATPTGSSPRIGRQLGPDPASTDIATVGGVIANNSGGMRCGVARDSYSHPALAQLRAGLGDRDRHAPPRTPPSGSQPPSRELAEGLLEIRDEIRADRELSERIRRKFEIKNTTGYRLCAFLDAEEPLEIFRRLLVGSEGTLGFVAEAVFETVPLPPRDHRRLDPLRGHRRGDRAGRRPGRRRRQRGRADGRPGADRRQPQHPRHPGDWRELPPDSAALLVEFGAEDAADLDGLRGRRSARSWAAHEPIRAVRLHPRSERDRARLAGARGHARADRQAAPAGDGADRRGRLRAPGADRRGGQGPAGAARRARLPPRRRRPRLGGEPPLHADPGLRQAGGPRSATRPSWASWSS